MRPAAIGVLSYVCVLSCALLSPVRATTLRVERDGSGDFSTLIDALGAAVEGDSLLVGEGRFDETQDVVLGCCWSVTAYAPIAVSEITITGAGKGLTVIGPEVPATEGLPPVGFGSIQGMPGLRIRSLTIENLVVGIVAYGELDAFDLAIESMSEAGIFSDSHDTTLVTSCEFRSCRNGVRLANGSKLWIRSCEFYGSLGSSLDLWGSQEVYFLESRSEGEWVGLKSTQGSDLVVRNSYVRSGQDAAGVSGGGSIDIYNSYLEGDEAAFLGIAGGRVEVRRSELVGHEVTVFLAATPDVLFSENDLTSSANRIVWLDDFFDMNGEKLDFRNNWWGTTDLDSIQAWIVDADHPLNANDPREEGYVEFLPILGESVPTESNSVGRLKGRFRGSRSAKN